MKNSFLVLFCFLIFVNLGCSNDQKKLAGSYKKETVSASSLPNIFTTRIIIPQQADTMIDSRDGTVYSTIKIGRQIWMAENLRFDSPGSLLNPENPSEAYGRLYDLISVQSVCPNGWHLPSDSEWDELEMAHGMPASFIGKGGWRGAHGTHMKAIGVWEDEESPGTNSLGFNVLPAGYYFSGKLGGEVGIHGLGFSAAFWSSIEEGKGWARFLFSSRVWVNKWSDTGEETGSALACRCLKD